MITGKVAALTTEVNHILDRRGQLLRQRDATQDLQQAEVLGESIAKIDRELVLPLRKRIHDIRNATHDHTDRKRLKKLEARLDRVISGIEIERESDISARHQQDLREALSNAKTNSERRRIDRKLRRARRDKNLYLASLRDTITRPDNQ